MRVAVLFILFVSTFFPNTQRSTPGHNYEFANGSCFDGQKFVNKKFYSVAGRLTSKRPARVDRVYDLSGKYVVPPFAEAHNHNLSWSDDKSFARVNKMYLEAGIFYVKNPNSLLRSREATMTRINLPTSVDGILSNGGLTASGGHPIEMVTPDHGFQPGDGEGGFYYIVDTVADLERKWSTIKLGKPDFIKTYLLYSEEYDKRKDDKAYDGWKGLNPAILPAIVQRAHRDGLRVSTHVETATDFHNAVIAGVDEINHVPGFRPDRYDIRSYANLTPYQISEADAKLAGEKRIVVVTTIGETAEQTFNERFDERGRLALRATLVENLRLLHKHGVAIAIGSDSFDHTALPEALSIAKLKVFDNLTLLKMWCETSAAAIFPKRKIGYIKDGYEASFLVLSANPLTDFKNVTSIEFRFKQGELLNP
jgi:imidazolonepropionase-like amidohydrolase